MGKGGRIACIFTPYLLSVGALVCLILVGLGSTRTSAPLKDMYFMRADLHDIDVSPGNAGSDYSDLAKGLQKADAMGVIEDFYTVGLWNYCYGDYDNGDYNVKECSERKAKFWFNPVEVWGLNDKVENLFPDELQKGLDTYQKVANWLFIAYVIAVVATGLQLLVGISAIFSRWGSFATTIFATVSALFTSATAVTASVLYGILTGALKGGLKKFNIDAAMSKDMYVAMWFGVLFALAGGLFWLFSVCCCSGRSPYGHGDRRRGGGVVAEKTPYTYERVSSPYTGHQRGDSEVPLNPMNPTHGGDTAYEPYRHGPGHV